MKVRVYIKATDQFDDSIREAVKSDVKKLDGLSAKERESLIEKRCLEVGEELERWVEYGECVTLEFDTEAQTATVCELD